MKESFGFIRHLALFMMLLCLTAAQAAEIGQVTVRATGGQILQDALEQLVYATIRCKVGGEFNPKVLTEDIAALYGTGNFQDIQTSSETGADGKVQVLFMVVPKKLVTAIEIAGNEVYKDSSLRHLLKQKLEVPADDQTVAADCAAIMEKYRSGGYYGTTVSSSFKDSADGSTCTLTYTVQESPRTKLQGVIFSGNTVFDDSEISSLLLTKRQWWRYIFRFGNYFNEQLLHYDKKKISDLYATRGYLDFAVEDVELRYDEERKWVTVVFKFYEGEPYTVGKISLEGNSRFTAAELLSKTTLASGQVYDSRLESLDITAMRREYETQGYGELKFIPRHDSDRSTQLVDITYKVVEGTPSRIRDIVIVGNEITKNKVIQRELAIQADDNTDLSRISLSKQRLQNLGYFESVEVYPIATPVPDLRDLRIDLKEKSTGTMSVGAGFSSEDSVMGFLEFTETNFDLSRLFDWPPKGGGQRFRAYLGVGTDVQNISLSLIEPAFLDRNLELANDLFVNTRFEDEYDERHIGGSSMLSWPIAFRLPGVEKVEFWRLGLGIRIEHIRISDVDDLRWEDDDEAEHYDYINYSLEDEEGGEFANRLILRLTRDTRDQFRFPTRGSRVALESEFVTSALGSYSNYFKFHAGGTKYVPVVQDFVLKMSLDGWAASHLSGDDIRIFDRYFGGGYGTIRGFKRRDVSPVNYNENPIGGLTMLMSSVELIKPIKDFMFVSIFTDIGNTWWDSFDADLGELNMSVGIGVQFKAVPIRLDYGYPVNTSGDYLDGKGGRFHFNIGISY
ncbi:MAG: outer membrane protein assembly factor BamA [Oligosphaeraceae bacterium]|nr:outer membrane protein assembly factor BamA [Oligosphaeraceae bacterium]